jgi:hypothetical protein
MFTGLLGSLLLGRLHFHNFRLGEVVGVNASIIYPIEPDNDWIFNTALVNGGNGTNVLVPVGLLTEDFDFRTALNHECVFLLLLSFNS